MIQVNANPFEKALPCGKSVAVVNADERCEMVLAFTWTQCRAAMKHACLQASVYQAIQRRLRQLERERLERAS